METIIPCLQIVEMDLADVVPSVSGPKRPHDRVSVSSMQEDFRYCLGNKVSTVYHYVAKFCQYFQMCRI